MCVFTIGFRSLRQPQFPDSAPTITTARDLLGGFISPFTLFSQTHAGTPMEHRRIADAATHLAPKARENPGTPIHTLGQRVANNQENLCTCRARQNLCWPCRVCSGSYREH